MSIERSITCNNGGKITAGLYGKVCKVAVKEGSKVKKGDNIIVMEAMKMENEIMAPKAGKVTSVNVQKGATVESGTLLCVVG